MTQTLEMHPSKWDNKGGREVLEAPLSRPNPYRKGLGMEPTPKNVCVIEDCDQPVHGRGWCHTHYRRWVKDGTTDLLRPAHGNRHPWPERFWNKVDKSGDCWLWTAYKAKNGYGRIGMPTGDPGRRSRIIEAHRVVWELEVGPIPEGLEIDHLCHVRACVNPAHLRLVTTQENTASTRIALATHCPEGHEYTYSPTTGKKRCLPCRTRTRQRWLARQVEQR